MFKPTTTVEFKKSTSLTTIYLDDEQDLEHKIVNYGCHPGQYWSPRQNLKMHSEIADDWFDVRQTDTLIFLGFLPSYCLSDPDDVGNNIGQQDAITLCFLGTRQCKKLYFSVFEKQRSRRLEDDALDLKHHTTKQNVKNAVETWLEIAKPIGPYVQSK